MQPAQLDPVDLLLPAVYMTDRRPAEMSFCAIYLVERDCVLLQVCSVSGLRRCNGLRCAMCRNIIGMFKP
jgi:hypothetical protein